MLASCEELVSDLNEDPNNPQSAESEYILTGAQLANIMVQEGEMARLTSMWAGYVSGFDRQYVNLFQYVTTTGDYDSPWGNLYAGAINQSNIVIAQAEAVSNRLTAGIAKITKANAAGTAAAMWGDVPFSQAGRVVEFPNPSYDSQADVYAAVQTLLDEAIADLQSGVGSTDGDIYGLSAAQWTAVAYTLKARYFMHTKQYTNANAAALNGIASASDNLMAPHGQTFGGNFNLWYDFLVYNRSSYMSANQAWAPTLIDPAGANTRSHAKTNEDARYNYLYQNNEFYADGPEPNYLCAFDWGYPNGFFGGDTDYPLVTFEENVLTLAETYARADDLANAISSLNTFRQFMSVGGYINPEYIDILGYVAQYDDFVQADFENGGLENQDGIATKDALLREIMEERYVTFVGQLEGFNDVRRTRTESFGVKPPPITGSSIPQRLLYPQSEINANSSFPFRDNLPDLFEPTPVFN